MGPVGKGLVGLSVLFLLLLMGVPIGFAMLLVGACGTFLLVGSTASLHAISEVTYGIISNFDWAVLPLFMFMSSLCLFAGFGERLFRLMHKLLGHKRGGLSMATVGACALFAAASASTIATAVTIGRVAIPEMKRYKYSGVLACASSAVGGVLGVLIPPSGVMIIYGIITGESIAKLFMAGIIPGIILAAAFCIVIHIWATLSPSIAPTAGPAAPFSERFRAFSDCWEMLSLIVFLIIGIAFGWFTATEAGAVGAFAAMILSLVRRSLSLSKMKDAVIDTLRSTGMVFTMIIGALVLNIFLTLSTVPMELANYVAHLGLSPFVVMVIIVITYVILGCVIDSMSMLLLTLPILFPLVKRLGFDPVWFGVVIVLLFEMAVLTPPVGMNVYVISGLEPDVPMEAIFKGVFPFLTAILFVIALLFLFPQLALFLPKRM